MTGAAVPREPGLLRPDAAALLLVALGFAARLLAARQSFVGFDEELHLRLASPESLREVYLETLTNAHPPLFFVLLHFWQRLVGAGWQLCLLPVAFGTAFLWVAHRWARSLFGAAASLTLLALLAFLPSVVLVSAELRGYATVLFLVACALAAFERALVRASAGWVAISAASMALALGTHYLALRSALALAAYAAVRLIASRPPSLLVRVWAASQAIVAAVFLFLYQSHISALRGSGMEKLAQTDWLQADYLQRGDGAQFVLRQAAALFRFLFSVQSLAAVAGALALAGIVLLARARRPAAILLALPFVLSVAGGLLRLYPYGGSRHSIDLALYASAAIGIAVARLTGERLWVPLLLAGALAPAAFALGW